MFFHTAQIVTIAQNIYRVSFINVKDCNAHIQIYATWMMNLFESFLNGV